MYLIVSLCMKYLFKILYIYQVTNNFSTIRVKNMEIKLKNKLTIKQHMDIITYSIISGMLMYVPIFFTYPYESAIAMIGYLISCSIDYVKLIKLYMINGN